MPGASGFEREGAKDARAEAKAKAKAPQNEFVTASCNSLALRVSINDPQNAGLPRHFSAPRVRLHPTFASSRSIPRHDGKSVSTPLAPSHSTPPRLGGMTGGHTHRGDWRDAEAGIPRAYTQRRMQAWPALRQLFRVLAAFESGVHISGLVHLVRFLEVDS